MLLFNIFHQFNTNVVKFKYLKRTRIIFMIDFIWASPLVMSNKTFRVIFLATKIFSPLECIFKKVLKNHKFPLLILNKIK